MNRAMLNFWVDAVAFVGGVFLAATGFLLKFILPPGSGRLVGEGSGWRASQKPVSLLWGWTRHEWGEIHFWIAVVLLAVLALHLFLHWEWIVCMVKRRPPTRSGARFAAGLFALLALASLVAALFLSPVRKLLRAELLNQPEQSSRTVH